LNNPWYHHLAENADGLTSTFVESSGTIGPADHTNGGEAAVTREWVAAGVATGRFIDG